ncbi:hypothetical protein LIA77_06304 [Sarocladium implicatum]|nr:hypothetical protein LIA77_06304 [Sarocladium implicatum]
MPRTLSALDEPAWPSGDEQHGPFLNSSGNLGRTQSDDEYEVVDYRPSDESGNSSPGPDQPPRLPSPSERSSATASSPTSGVFSGNSQHDRVGATTTIHASPVSRQALAQRLARIARQLATTPEDELPFDELSLMEQVNHLELTILGISSPPSRNLPRISPPADPVSTLPIRTRPLPRGRSDSISQEAVVDSAARLSADLETLHSNLCARQEEASHIQALLLSRLELAAQRIIVLEQHAAALESQLRDSDDEVSHMRVLLKALEIQVPEHPDDDMRRCLDRVREEFWAVRKRRQATRRQESHGIKT